MRYKSRFCQRSQFFYFAYLWVFKWLIVFPPLRPPLNSLVHIVLKAALQKITFCNFQLLGSLNFRISPWDYHLVLLQYFWLKKDNFNVGVVVLLNWLLFKSVSLQYKIQLSQIICFKTNTESSGRSQETVLLLCIKNSLAQGIHWGGLRIQRCLQVMRWESDLGELKLLWGRLLRFGSLHSKFPLIHSQAL